MRTLCLSNARIWTGRAARPWARSLTIETGRVTALDEPPSRGAVLIDAGGRTVTPGLADAHVHLLLGGLALERLDLSCVRSRAAFERAIAAQHAQLAPGSWLVAHGWSQESWPGAAMPDKSWLTAAGERPVVCHRTDLHAALVNDAVLARCDLDRPARVGHLWGGRIERDAATGEPTGLMIEAAAWELVNPLVPEAGRIEKRRALCAAQAHLHRLGVTAVGTMEYWRDLEETYVPLRDELSLRCRVILLDREWPMSFDPGRDFPGDERLAVIGYKSYLDGTLGSRSARMLEDWSDDAGNRGLLVELAARGDLQEWAHAVAAAGLSPVMHAIGDEGARLALDVVESLARDHDLDKLRPRIEHAQQLDFADLPRFRGVIASMQPLHKADDGCYARRRVGESRLAGTFAFRRLLDAGARLAFGSDWPVVSGDPLAGVRAAVTGLTSNGHTFLPDQNLTAEEALRAYTSGAAYALGLDDAGRVAPGALGDLVMFDGDPFTADWSRSPPRVVMTIVGGEVVHEGGSPG